MARARESRVNIVISDALRGGAQAELPFRVLVMGDFTMKPDKRPIEAREPQPVTKSNFETVMQGFNLALNLSVPNRIAGSGELPVSLRFGTLKDFRPESIARQVPELQNLLELREAIKALRTKMGDKAVQQELMRVIKDPALRDSILAMITTPSQSPGEGDDSGSAGTAKA